MPNDLATKIRRVRLALDLLQYAVAHELGMKERTYSDYEQGKRTFNVAHFEKLAAFFKVSVGELHDLTYEELIPIVLQRTGGGRNPELNKGIQPYFKANRLTGLVGCRV